MHAFIKKNMVMVIASLASLITILEYDKHNP